MRFFFFFKCNPGCSEWQLLVVMSSPLGVAVAEKDPFPLFLLSAEKNATEAKTNCWLPRKQANTHTQASQHPFTHMHGQTNWENTNCCLHTWASTRRAFKSIPSLVYQSRLNVIRTGRSTTCAHEHTHIQNKNYSTMSLYCEHAISACSNGAIW